MGKNLYVLLHLLPILGAYKLSQQVINAASFQENDIKFSSKEGISNGQIIITEVFDNQVSGNFIFQDLKSSNGGSTSRTRLHFFF